MNPLDDNQDQQSKGLAILQDGQFPSGIIKPRMLSADTTQKLGDLYYVNSSGFFQRLAPGTAGQNLQTNGITAAPSWVTIPTTNNFSFYEVEAPSYSTSSVSFASIDGTNLKRTITPTSASSKIKLTFCGTFVGSGSGAITGQFKFVRNPAGTPVSLMDSVVFLGTNENDTRTFVAIDSPATTSATVYDCQWMTNVFTLGLGTSTYGVSFLIEELKS